MKFLLSLFDPDMTRFELKKAFLNSNISRRAVVEKFAQLAGLEEFVEIPIDPSFTSFPKNSMCSGYPEEIFKTHYEFVRKIGEEILTIGVDHSVTYDTVKAVGERLGEIQVIIIDFHTDSFPLGTRTCTSFVPYLTNIASYVTVVGVSNDELLVYPGVKEAEEKGVNFFPSDELRRDPEGTAEKIVKELPVYLSVDLDVGANMCFFAVRFWQCVGIELEPILKFVETLSRTVKICGADFMEIDPLVFGVKDDPTPSALKELIRTVRRAMEEKEKA